MEDHSDKARWAWGNGRVWRTIHVSPVPPPEDLSRLREEALRLADAKAFNPFGRKWYVTRSAVKGERGFHVVCSFLVPMSGSEALLVARWPQHRGNPDLPRFLDYVWKQQPEHYGGFHRLDPDRIMY